MRHMCAALAWITIVMIQQRSGTPSQFIVPKDLQGIIPQAHGGTKTQVPGPVPYNRKPNAIDIDTKQLEPSRLLSLPHLGPPTPPPPPPVTTTSPKVATPSNPLRFVPPVELNPKQSKQIGQKRLSEQVPVPQTRIPRLENVPTQRQSPSISFTAPTTRAPQPSRSQVRKVVTPPQKSAIQSRPQSKSNYGKQGSPAPLLVPPMDYLPPSQPTVSRRPPLGFTGVTGTSNSFLTTRPTTPAPPPATYLPPKFFGLRSR